MSVHYDSNVIPSRYCLILLLLTLGGCCDSALTLKQQQHKTTQQRRSVLLPWTLPEPAATADGKPLLGWIVEETLDETTNDVQKVTVGWMDQDPIEIQLPTTDNLTSIEDTSSTTTIDELSTSIWPAGLAGAILGQSMSSVLSNQSVLELGSGVGLMGWVASQHAASTILTDHDHRTVARLQQKQSSSVTAQYLEWKDASIPSTLDAAQPMHPSKAKVDMIIASDIAYYWYLLRPILDTVQSYLDPDTGTLVIVGGANRQSQWDLYDHIRHGCYNPNTDQREGPWPGRTRMLLFRLRMGEWMLCDSSDTDRICTDRWSSELPMAVIVHERDPLRPCLQFSPLHDHVATEEDRESILISF